ncbi:MAG: CD1871A family CXXC motif-containing protein [Acidaminococcaceae bacterium]|nr:CD1871A family CXXC motif-containing protein [Acidaminococcaceae bacterium]MDD4721182.1 CD1871A family CXXC motif-containing protein [Acidaminococcaceae bacterium]
MKKLLWIIAICLLAFGLYKQDYLSVLQKAAVICLECVGIG